MALTGLLVMFVVMAVLAHRAEPFLRAQIVQALSGRFRSRVELDSFRLRFGNSLRGEWGVWADGRGLRIWPADDAAGSGTPLIQLAEFRFHAPLHYKPGIPVHIREVQLKGLDINLPPKSHPIHFALGDHGSHPSNENPPMLTFRVDEVVCTNARLLHEPDAPGKEPLDFFISFLKLTETTHNAGITPQKGMKFEANLTNPRPVGTIHSTGSFGPWQVDDPGSSPVAGNYRFENANLATFKGIAGTLNSTGRYEGTLRDIQVDGETDTPDFSLSESGNAMALHTNFHAKVDGTSGDTWLDPVEATLGRSQFTVKGKIVRVLENVAGSAPHSLGHQIDLTVDIPQGRIEDFTHLASHDPGPLLTGTLTLNAALQIPPGTIPAHRRMTMTGRFALDQAQFTNTGVKGRVRELSLRGQGRVNELKSPDSADVAAHIEGNFAVAGAVIRFPALYFKVPGANIGLKGTYALDGGALDFIGNARMQVALSKMVGGWKGFLLKAADPFFKDGSGADIPIHIGGTNRNPKIGLDFAARGATSPESPDRSESK
jgi:hypothetical protein